ncbi:MAG TPA: alpha/beta hydrolase, partial [Candidatus Binatia bacterium]|nr:alpha/beta hydrolase [Candidatus Binatia bacterium]
MTSHSLERAALLLVYFSFAAMVATAADYGPGFARRSVAVDGDTVSVTTGGRGPAVLLLHGYAETSRMWKPLAKTLAPRFT